MDHTLQQCRNSVKEGQYDFLTFMAGVDTSLDGIVSDDSCIALDEEEKGLIVSSFTTKITSETCTGTEGDEGAASCTEIAATTTTAPTTAVEVASTVSTTIPFGSASVPPIGAGGAAIDKTSAWFDIEKIIYPALTAILQEGEEAGAVSAFGSTLCTCRSILQLIVAMKSKVEKEQWGDNSM